MISKFTTCAAAAVLTATPLIAFAQINNFCDIVRLTVTIARWFGIIVFVVAIIAILYAAFLFLTSGGNPERAGTARNTLVFAVIGIAVALLAVNAQTIVQATVGGNTFDPTSCSVGPASTIR